MTYFSSKCSPWSPLRNFFMIAWHFHHTISSDKYQIFLICGRTVSCPEKGREREIQNKSCRRMGYRGGHTGDKTEQNYNLPYLAKIYSLMKFLIIVVWLTVMNVNVNPPYFHGFYFRARVTDEGGLVVVWLRQHWSDSQVSVEVEQQVNNPDLSLLSYNYWLTRD